jgi:hypothetical protein
MAALSMSKARLSSKFGVPPLGGQGLNVEGVGSENPALNKFPALQAIDARPAKAGTPNPSGSWPQLTSMLEVVPLHEPVLECGDLAPLFPGAGPTALLQLTR